MLQAAPEQFPAEEFPISESKVNMDVNFPGAAFVIVSCKESQSGFRKEWVIEGPRMAKMKDLPLSLCEPWVT